MKVHIRLPDIPSVAKPDWAEVELRFWRGRLISALDRRSVTQTFERMTAHAAPAPFVYDAKTRCMVNLRRSG